MMQLARTIGLRSATLLVLSAIVGTGVFKKVAPMAAELHAPLWVLGCWVLAGLISLAGALTNAEMAGMFPRAGGEYAYYQHTFGRLFAFLYGWGSFVVMKTATIAAQAYIFGQSLLALTGIAPTLTTTTSQWAATALIAVLTALNFRGLAASERVSQFLSAALFGAIAVVVVVGFRVDSGSWANLITASSVTTPPTGWALLNALTLALLGAFWAYEGWNYIGYMGEEVQEPQRTLPRALVGGTAVVIACYVLLNVVYLYALPIDTLARFADSPSTIAAIEVVRRGSGAVGVAVVSGLLVLTTFNATNATVLMSARLLYAMARDGLFFKSAAVIHPTYKTPATALLWQGVWAIGLVWSGSFDQLTDTLVFAAFLFYGATAVGVVWLRLTQPQAERPFRVPGYPVLPVVFAVFCLLLVVLTGVSQPRQALTGLGLLATGLPFYWFWKHKPTNAPT